VIALFGKKAEPEPVDPVDSAEVEINGVKLTLMGPSTKWLIIVITIALTLMWVTK
jgi:hypothetical protein